jgi:prepilin-type N-terminal cleavage/methylation domain-containing protein
VVRQPLPGLNRRGFSLTELAVVIGIVGVIAAVSIPSLITYFQASTLKGGAEEVVGALNVARQLAITQNRSICFEVVGNQYRYRQTNCTGTIWMGPGSGDNGFFRLSNSVQLATNANPIFDYLGSATTAATLTITYVNQAGTPGECRNIAVAASGRIQVQPTCP